MLNIALVNGSPKFSESGSGYLLEDLKSLIKDASFSEYKLNKPEITDIEAEELLENEILVFAFPLYVDGIPSHLLHCLLKLEQIVKNRKANIVVYTIVNCGFYEGHQNENAIQILNNWCRKANLRWGQGIGIGAGGMISSIHTIPHGVGPKKNISIALQTLADHISDKKSGKNIYASPGFPASLYKMAAEKGWKQLVKASGLKTKDLFRKID